MPEDVQQILNDPNFHALPLPEKNKVLLRVDPNFRALAPKERMKALDAIQYGPQPIATPAPTEPLTLRSGLQAVGQGVTDVLSGLGQGVLDVAAVPFQVAKAAAVPPQDRSEQIAALAGPEGLVAKRLVYDPLKEASAKAKASEGPQKYGYGLASTLPVVGPLAASIGESIQKPSDIPGQLARGIGWGVGGELAGAVKLPGPKAPLPPPEVFTDILGRVVKEQIERADLKLHQEVSKHADHIAKVVDDPARNPLGAIDAAPVVDSLKSLWERYVKTYSSAAGTKPPTAFEGVMDEAVRTPTGKWTWEQAKQIRSTISDIAAESKDPKVRAIASQVSKKLKVDLRDAADEAGVAKDFDIYNKLHSQQQRIREQVINKVKDAISGEDVMGTLHRNLGYVQNTFPSLAAYGLEADPMIDAARLSKSPTSKVWRGWMIRHASAELLQALMGAPYMAGYFAGGLGGEALAGGLSKQAKLMARSPHYGRGMQLLQESLPEGPTEVSTPTPVPPPPEPVAPKALPPVPQFPKEIPVSVSELEGGRTPVAPEVIAAEVKPSKYAQLQEKLTYLRTINGAIRRLSSGSPKPLTESEIGWIEQETGLNMADPANISSARRALIKKRNALRNAPREKK